MLTGVLAEHGGWRLALSTLGALTFIGAIGVARWLPASRGFTRQRGVDSLSCFRDHLRNPVLDRDIRGRLQVLFSLVGDLQLHHVSPWPVQSLYRLGPVAQGALFFVYLPGIGGDTRRRTVDAPARTATNAVDRRADR